VRRSQQKLVQRHAVVALQLKELIVELAKGLLGVGRHRGIERRGDVEGLGDGADAPKAKHCRDETI
jgi:hypothetical protein